MNNSQWTVAVIWVFELLAHPVAKMIFKSHSRCPFNHTYPPNSFLWLLQYLQPYPVMFVGHIEIHTHARTHARTHTHTHTHLTALCPGLPGTRKVKPIWILLKQETVSGSGISWAICKSAFRSRQITMPAPQHSNFLQARCSSCHSTNSVKALKAYRDNDR